MSGGGRNLKPEKTIAHVTAQCPTCFVKIERPAQALSAQDGSMQICFAKHLHIKEICKAKLVTTLGSGSMPPLGKTKLVCKKRLLIGWRSPSPQPE